MFKIRRNVFETNSSSTHTITICSEKEYGEWKKGKYYWNTDKLIPAEEIKEKYTRLTGRVLDDSDESKEDFNEWLHDYGYYSWEGVDDMELEFYEERFTTEHSDTIVAFGNYGWDG